MRITVHPASAWPDIAPIWDALVRDAPNASFFLSRTWTDAWFDVFAPQLKPEILIIESGDGPIGACILVARRRGYGPLSWQRLHLNTTGEDEADSPCLEMNDVLCRAGAERDVADALWSHLAAREWDEFVIKAARDTPAVKSVEAAAAGVPDAFAYRCEQSSRRNYYVPLTQIRDFSDYLQRLSRNTRDQIRRSLKLYEQTGKVEVEAATSVPRAMEMMRELAELHQKTWTGRGRPGVFASSRFQAFHAALVQRGFAAGHIQILRIGTPAHTIGLLYNFVWRGHVCFYQSGLHYADDNRYKPGLVSHLFAIQHACDQGCHEYDFLAGESRYKSSLSLAERTMVWTTWQRLSTKQRLRAWWRGAKRYSQRMR